MIAVRHGLMLIAPLVLVLAAFFLLPVLMMLPTSFGEYVPGAGLAPGVWTLENYTRIVTDDYYREVIWRTLSLGLFVTVT
jgi:putative spermidine/putrescine transport system permease protein